MAVKVTKTTRVNPSTNSSHNTTNSLHLPLAFFDLRWIKFHPTERLIFYKLHNPNSFHSLILPNLEYSLSTVLSHYLPLAGHLKWDPQDPKPHILVLPNDNVTLIIAESNADFSFLSGKEPRPETEIRSLVPELHCDHDDDSPCLLSLQVTLFPNQGFSIGVTAHHSAMDGKSMSMFIKSWAHICKHGTIREDLTPCLDRTVINVPTSLDARIMNFLEDKNSLRSLKLHPVVEISPEMVRITLELTRENVDKLKERAKHESTRSNLHLSTFVVTSAYLWSCLVKTRGSDVDSPVRFMYAADFRNRLGEPVPESYFGNCVFPTGCFGHRAGVLSGGDGFVKAVEIISDSVRGVVVGSLNIEGICELYIDGTKSVEPGTQTTSIVGSNRFGLYESDFGWGKPVSCETVSIDRSEAFSLSERRDESGGVEIGLCLKKCEMDLFISLFQNGL